MNKRVFKTALIFMSACILFFSQNSYAQTKETNPANQPEKRPGPPNGGRPGGGGSPEQPESLAQMKGFKIGDKAADFFFFFFDGKRISLAGL